MATSPRTPNPSPLHRQPAKPHIAIIGGGITGVTSALFLAESGFPVTLLEKKGLGNGASCRSAAACRAQFDTELTVRGMHYAIGWLRDFHTHYGGEPAYEGRGYLFTYRTPEAFANAVERNAAQRAWGLTEAVVLTPTQVKDMFPYVDTNSLMGATWCPIDGFMKPDVIYTTAAERAQELGAAIVQNAEVVGVKKHGNIITHLVAHKKTFGEPEEDMEVPVDLVVNATGIWAPHAADKILGCTKVPIRPEQVFVYQLGQNGTPIDLSIWPFIATESGAYCRPIDNNSRVLLGWVRRTRPLTPDFSDEQQDEIPMEFSHHNPEGYGYEMWSELAGWVPALQHMGMAVGTSGIYDTMPDHNPVVDFDLSIANLVHAVGFSGHGAMHAPFTAAVVRHLVQQGTRQWTMELDGHVVSLRSFAIDREFGKHAEKVIL